MFSLPQRTLTVLRLAAEEENAEVTTTAQGAGGGDDAEWKALVAAFQMYKAAYGDLKVPSRFIVPSMPPWPGPFSFFFVAVKCHMCVFVVSNL